MKHHMLISRKPEVAQSTLQVKLAFLLGATDNLLQIFDSKFGATWR